MLIITKWGTVKDEEDDYFKERKIIDFIREINQKIEKNGSKFCFIEEKNHFWINLDGVEYRLKLEKEWIENYKEGKYNEITRMLKALEEKQKQIDLIEMDKDKEYRRKNRLLSSAKKGVIETQEAKELYIDYLTEQNKFKLSNIGTYIENFIEDWTKSFEETEERLFDSHIPFADDFSLSQFHLLWTLVSLATTAVSAIFYAIFKNITFGAIATGLTLLPQVYSIASSLYNQAKRRIERAKEHIKNKTDKKEIIENVKNLELEKKEEKFLSLEERDKGLKTYGMDMEEVLKKVRDIMKILEKVDSKMRREFTLSLVSIFQKYTDTLTKIEEEPLDLISESTLNINTIQELENLEVLIKDYNVRKKAIMERHDAHASVEKEIKELGSEFGLGSGMAQAVEPEKGRGL